MSAAFFVDTGMLIIQRWSKIHFIIIMIIILTRCSFKLFNAGNEPIMNCNSNHKRSLFSVYRVKILHIMCIISLGITNQYASNLCIKQSISYSNLHQLIDIIHSIFTHVSLIDKLLQGLRQMQLTKWYARRLLWTTSALLLYWLISSYSDI
jgi:hypothetical protein